MPTTNSQILKRPVEKREKKKKCSCVYENRIIALVMLFICPIISHCDVLRRNYFAVSLEISVCVCEKAMYIKISILLLGVSWHWMLLHVIFHIVITNGGVD